MELMKCDHDQNECMNDVTRVVIIHRGTQAYYIGQDLLIESSGYLSMIQKKEANMMDKGSMGGCMDHSNRSIHSYRSLGSPMIF